MKPRLFILLLTLTVQLAGQTNKSSTAILSQADIKQIFSDDILKKFNIDYKIFRVYNYNDKTGKYYIVLTEKTDSIKPNKDTLHYKIKAFNFQQSKSGLVKKWEVNDFLLKQNENSEEYSIWFWTKYCEFQDLDKDGIVDPILVYGTIGMNGHDDGRTKIVVYYKGQKNVIRHQNGVLDFQRNTQVDSTFYLLPQPIQEHVKTSMQKMIDNSHGIFPYGWQEAMKKRKTKFQEKQTGY